MNRPAGVTVSAIFLILGSVFVALIGVIMLFARSLAPPATPQPPFMETIMIFTACIFFALALWGVLAAFGLFRMRPWARLSILVIAALLVIFCGFSAAMLLFVAQQVPELEATGKAGWLIGAMVGMYTIPFFIGLWWLFYFNRAKVKAAFLEGVQAPSGPVRPLSIAVIAWHLVAFALVTPIGLWFRYPVLMLGVLITGWSAVLVYSALVVVELSVGIGLLRLKPWSLKAAVWFCVFLMLNSIVLALVPDSNAKILAAMKPILSAYSADLPPGELPNPMLNAALGVLMAALPLYYLVTRKQAFLEAGRAADASKIAAVS